MTTVILHAIQAGVSPVRPRQSVAFHSFFEACTALKSDEPLRSSRLALCELTGRILSTGLGLLDIRCPERM